MKILVIGESCNDVFEYGVCIRLCPEAPVPVFNPTHTTQNPGMAKNFQQNLTALGASAVLHTNRNWRSITKTRFIDYRTNHMFMRLDKNDKNYGRCKLDKINFNKYDAVVISDYNKGFLSEEDIRVISLKHRMVFLDTKKKLGLWCKNVAYVKINKDEYDITRGEITDIVYDRLIITLGAEGAQHNDIIYSVPAVEIKDTSGAGDTFISGLAVKYIETKDIEEAIKFANSCATTVVQKRGVSVL